MNPEYPSETGIEDFPQLLRRETGLMEFICVHGVGHPAPASAVFMDEIYMHKAGTWAIHGCDGCCSKETFPDIRYVPARLEIV